MNTAKTCFACFLVTIAAFSATRLETSYAKVLDRNDVIARKEGSDEAKTYVLEIKAKIAGEREGIIAADKRLREAKKTGDKAAIEQVKKEVDQDIKSRKAAIKSMHDDINGKIGQRDDFIPSRKDRAKK